jgi:integrase/recombinase XerD
LPGGFARAILGGVEPPREPSPRPPIPAGFRAGCADFLEALRVEAGLARNTLAAYRRDLYRFVRFAAERGAEAWGDLSPDRVVAHLAALRAAGYAEASVARALSAVRMALRHQVAEGRLVRDPTALIAAPVLARSLPGTLSAEEVERLVTAPRGDGWAAQRDRALLELLYATGARVSEAVGLRTDGLEPSLRVVTVTGKGNKTRVVPLGSRARGALDAWLRGGRAALSNAARERAVFLTKAGRPMSRTDAWRRVHHAALAAGLTQRIYPHLLRHSFASHMIEGGADLRSVQEMLGHASIRTTEVYSHLDAEHVRSLHRLYHPRG